MLSQTSEHAIRAVLFLAQQAPGEQVPAERIARALGAPANYLGKTLNTLARRGFLASSRGSSGGFRLARAAGDITIAGLVEAVSDVARPAARCLLGDRPCRADAPCAAHARWSAVQQAMWAPLRGTTVADLLDPGFNHDFDAAAVFGVLTRAALAA